MTIYRLKDGWESFKREVLEPSGILESGDETTAKSLRIVFYSGAITIQKIMAKATAKSTANAEVQAKSLVDEMSEFQKETGVIQHSTKETSHNERVRTSNEKTKELPFLTRS